MSRTEPRDWRATRRGSARPARECPRAARAAGAGARAPPRGDSRDPRGTRPALTIARRSRFVAAMMRTSTRAHGVGADALDLPALEHAQQLGLQRRGAARRSRPGRRCRPGPPRRRRRAVRSAPVKAPRSWPKSWLSSRFCRCSAAVHDDERPVVARARLMDRFGGHVLAGARLALEQHGGLGGGDAFRARQRRCASARWHRPGRRSAGGGEREGVVLYVEIEADHAASDANVAAVMQVRFDDARAVHERSVQAVEIANARAPSVHHDLAVKARDGGIVEHQIVGGMGADRRSITRGLPADALTRRPS